MGSFITVTGEDARAAAIVLDQRIASGGAAGLGPLAGVPVGIKVGPLSLSLSHPPHLSLSLFLFLSLTLSLSFSLRVCVCVCLCVGGGGVRAHGCKPVRAPVRGLRMRGT